MEEPIFTNKLEEFLFDKKKILSLGGFSRPRLQNHSFRYHFSEQKGKFILFSEWDCFNAILKTCFKLNKNWPKIVVLLFEISHSNPTSYLKDVFQRKHLNWYKVWFIFQKQGQLRHSQAVVKRVLWKISKKLQGNICVWVSSPAFLLKGDTSKFARARFLKNFSGGFFCTFVKQTSNKFFESYTCVLLNEVVLYDSHM